MHKVIYISFKLDKYRKKWWFLYSI